MSQMVSKVEFCRRLALTPGRVSQLAKKGLPLRSDGTLDLVKATRWFAENVRPPLLKDGAPNPTFAQVEAVLGGELKPADDSQTFTRAEFRQAWLRAHQAGQAYVANALRAPHRVQAVAEMAARLGCTAAQAFGIAALFETLVTEWVFPMSEDAAEEIKLYSDRPDWEAVAKLAGEPLDIKAWRREVARLLGGEKPVGKSKRVRRKGRPPHPMYAES